MRANDERVKRRLRQLIRQELSRTDVRALVHEALVSMDLQAIVQEALHARFNMTSASSSKGRVQQRVLH